MNCSMWFSTRDTCNGIEWMGVLLLFLFSQPTQAQDRDDQVFVRLDIFVQEQFVQVACHIKNPHPESRVFLSCPLLREPRFCFHGCHSVCQSVGGMCPENTVLLLNSTKCTVTKRDSENAMIVSYLVDSSKAGNNGLWQCLHAGKRSSSVLMEKYMPPSTSSSTSSTTTVPPSSTKDIPVTKSISTNTPVAMTSRTTSLIPLPISDPMPDNSKKSDAMMKTRLYENVTRPELVVAIIVLLFISFILNIAFCTRCILVRRFIVLEKQNQTPSSSLLQCLCIPVHQYATYKHRKLHTSSHGVLADSHDHAHFTASSKHGQSNGKVVNSMSASLHQLPTLRYLNMSETLEVSSNGTGNQLIYEDPNQFLHTMPKQGYVKGRRQMEAQGVYRNPAQDGSMSGGRKVSASSHTFSGTSPGCTNTGMTMLVPAALFTDPHCRTVYALPLSQHNSTSQLCTSGNPPLTMYDEVAHSNKRHAQMPPSLSTFMQAPSALYTPTPSNIQGAVANVNLNSRHNNNEAILSVSRNSINDNSHSGETKLFSSSCRSDATGCEEYVEETTATPPLIFSVMSSSTLPSSSDIALSGIPYDQEQPSHLEQSRKLLTKADSLLKEASSLLTKGSL